MTSDLLPPKELNFGATSQRTHVHCLELHKIVLKFSIRHLTSQVVKSGARRVGTVTVFGRVGTSHSSSGGLTLDPGGRFLDFPLG